MGRIIWNTDVNAPCCPGEIVDEDTGRTILIHVDWDYPGTADSFGWDKRAVQPDPSPCHFERFTLSLPREAVSDCSHQGPCDDSVSRWAGELEPPGGCTAELIREELEEYGAWTPEELRDDAANWRRIVWIAACNANEEPCDHSGTDGTVDCPDCGATVDQFLSAAREWLDANDGATADDPGYFD